MPVFLESEHYHEERKLITKFKHMFTELIDEKKI